MENITIKDADFAQLLPTFMKNDITNIALSEVVNYAMKRIYPRITKLSIWNQLEQMDESELDQLADYLAISWYWYGATIEQKRQIIKDARKVHRHLGTVWALQYVLTIYFGEAKIMEWPDYGGAYGHFKIESNGLGTLTKTTQNFLDIVCLLKRMSATLDGIMGHLESDLTNRIISTVTSCLMIETSNYTQDTGIPSDKVIDLKVFKEDNYKNVTKDTVIDVSVPQNLKTVIIDTVTEFIVPTMYKDVHVEISEELSVSEQE